MRHILILVLLFTAALSWEGNDGGVPGWNDSRYASWGSGTASRNVDSEGYGAVDANDTARLLRLVRPRPDMWVAALGLDSLDSAPSGGAVEPPQMESLRAPSLVEEAVGENPYLEEATFTAYLSIYCCLNDDTGAYCGDMASGLRVFDGAAACDPALTATATTLKVGNRIVQCLDTGNAVYGKHVDVWFYDCGDQQDPKEGTGWWWLRQVGTYAEVEVEE